MEPIKVDFTGKGGSDKGKGSGNNAYLAPSKSGLKTIISIVGTIIGALIAYYFMLPALNFKSTELYMFLGLIAVIYIALNVLLSGAIFKPEYTEYAKKRSIIPGIFIGVLVVIVVIGMIISSVVFRAKSYRNIITVDESKTFSSDIEQADFQSVPVLDNAAAAVLATRTLGDLASINKVSQFEVATDFTQINYKNSPVRVTTLAYGDIFKWIKNTSTGLPGYIVVDMVTQKADLVMLEEGNYIRYSTNEHFSKYLMRHVRFNYPTYIFDTPHFEIDESGNPFWLCPVLDKTIGMFGGTDVKGVVIVNAITGECNEYGIDEVKNDKSLQWIDSIYSSALLVEQYNYYGKYVNGFINSILGQEGVKIATEGSNYLAMNDDVYMYTGVTSTGEDQAIIGFVLVNMRTKDANFYTVSGAKEYSAAASAEGVVQDYAYTATFPILLNISGQPTYFMSLKDSSNLVKRYAMVNVQNFQVVVTGETIAECTEAYAAKLKQNNINIKVDIDQIKQDTDNNTENPDTPKAETVKLKGKITDIRTAVMNGDSVYFIKLEGNKTYFTIAAADAQNVVILNVGDTVTVEYEKASGNIIEAVSVK
ncbi:MAG: CvpA family protein [Faecalibacterium sp.]|nr:CvpA family protein [Ruminococcus sp.]MCM1393110.1 CvpA family protein [Ruminococcus sp.]MCM1486601.1 CvpA family protein [Faecalibacterium sp.]